MALLILIIYLIVLLILFVKYKKSKRMRDLGIVLMVFGVLLPIIIYLFIPQNSRTPILDREFYLYRGNILLNGGYYYKKISYKIPIGFGVFFLAMGLLTTVLGKNSNSENEKKA